MVFPGKAELTELEIKTPKSIKVLDKGEGRGGIVSPKKEHCSPIII